MFGIRRDYLFEGEAGIPSDLSVPPAVSGHSEKAGCKVLMNEVSSRFATVYREFLPGLTFRASLRPAVQSVKESPAM